MKRLAIITTHPIQYYAPIFKLLHQRGLISIKVYYTWGEKALDKFDPGFGQKVNWDIPLLDGYPYEWVLNTARDPGTHHTKGIVNPKLTEQISVWNPDAVLFFGWAYKGHLKAIKYYHNKIPVYFRGDSTLLNEPTGLKGIIKYFALRWVYRHVDHAFYVGTNNKTYFRKYGLSEDQLSFAPHAIDNSRFEKDYSEEAAELRQSLNIKDEEILILYAGKFDHVKNVELLLSAFINLHKGNIKLLLVGNGPLESELKKLAATSNSSNIHFLDFQNQTYMPVLYQAADLFCLPSISETWGLAINEAMACGLAVLTSDKVGCAVDLVKEDYNGAIFQSNRADDLIAKLAKLINSKAVLREYGDNSRKLIKNWSFEHIAEAIENNLNETI
ncbi:MAG: glycosyltransferase family 4 protein [Bacteroidetes bacterium]|jgi:glycosyltransferase involved in cell wall biosynthesis|nr:glycosyltransferase family 4 protein [Bacteroidota bacterium]